MGAQPKPDVSWSRWRWLAVGLAIVTMAVSVLGPGGPPGLGAPEAVSRVAVPGVGVWLAATGQTRRARLGLGTLAAWGVVFHAPSLLAVLVLVVAEPPVGQEVMAALFAVGWRGLPVAVAGAALLALRTGGDRSVLEMAGRRRAAALGIALWALAGLGVVLVGSRTGRCCRPRAGWPSR